jgi:hypothetical protein
MPRPTARRFAAHRHLKVEHDKKVCDWGESVAGGLALLFREELPIFLPIFLLPAAAAVFVRWKLS